MSTGTEMIVVGSEMLPEDLLAWANDMNDDVSTDGASPISMMARVKPDKASPKISVMIGDHEAVRDEEIYIAVIAVFNSNNLYVKIDKEDIRMCSTGFTHDKRGEQHGFFAINDVSRPFQMFDKDFGDGSIVKHECSGCKWAKPGTKTSVGGDGDGRACSQRKTYIAMLVNQVGNIPNSKLGVFQPGMLVRLDLPMGSNYKFPGEVATAASIARSSFKQQVPSFATVLQIKNKITDGQGAVKFSVLSAKFAGIINMKAYQEEIKGLLEEAKAIDESIIQNVEKIVEKEEIPF